MPATSAQIVFTSLTSALLLVPMWAVAEVSALQASSAAASSDGGWQFASEREGVSVWFRRFPNSSVNEVRGEAVFEVSAEALFAVLGDIESYADLMPPTSLAQRLPGDGSGKRYYIEIDPPVVSRRYYCMDVNLSRQRPDVFVSEWRMWSEGCVPRKSSLVPMRDNSGRWRLSALAPMKTRVEFQAHMDPGGQIPTWMVNRTTDGQIAKTFHSLRRASLLPRYAVASPPKTEQPSVSPVSVKTN